MKKTFRFICLFLTAVLCLSFCVGCGRKKGEPPVSTSDKKVVMTLGGYNVTHDFYRYLFLNTKFFYDNGDDSYWQKEGNDIEKIKDYVMESLKSTYSMFTLADKYEITLSKDEIAYIKAAVEESKANYTEEEFAKEMADAYMSEELYTFILKIQSLETLVYEHITAEDSNIIVADKNTVDKAIQNDFVRATHILFTFDNDADKQLQLSEAEKVLERLKKGEDFETLKEEYSKDTNLKNNKDGYYFTHGVYRNDFEYTAFELEIGEISDIVTTENGFHIIKRLPIEQEYVNKNYSDILSQFITSQYYEILDDVKNDLQAEFKDGYKNIDFNTFK